MQTEIEWGTHQSDLAHSSFLQEVFYFMFGQGQWVVLTQSVDNELPGLRFFPPRIKEERGVWLMWIRDYMFITIDSKILPIANFLCHTIWPVFQLFVKGVSIRERRTNGALASWR